MKIIDSFIARDEVELIKLRIKLLGEYVNHFYIIESDMTHQGDPKDLVLAEAFRDFGNVTVLYCELPQEATPLEREILQRNSSKDLIPEDWDILLLSDVDEIPDISKILEYKKNNPDVDKACCVQQLSYYYVNNVAVSPDHHKDWWGTIVLFESSDLTAQQLRDSRRTQDLNSIDSCGYHWSYLGGVESIIKKLETFHHREFAKPPYTEKNYLKEILEKGHDLFNRGYTFTKVDINLFPSVVLEYPEFIL